MSLHIEEFDQFSKLIEKSLNRYAKYSLQLNDMLYTQSKLACDAIHSQLKYLKSENESEFTQFTNKVMKVQNFPEENAVQSNFEDHVSAVSQGIAIAACLSINIPANDISEIFDTVKFYTNRVLDKWKTVPNHIRWVNSWLKILTDILNYIVECKTYEIYSMSGDRAHETCTESTSMTFTASGGDALLITKDTSKNETLIDEEMESDYKIKIPVLHYNNCCKWLVENRKGEESLLINEAGLDHVIHMKNCINTCLRVEGTVKTIILSDCKKPYLVVDSISTVLQIKNCEKVQIQVLGKVPAIMINQTVGSHIYLSISALEAQIITSMSSEVSVVVSEAKGDFLEYIVPEQCRTIFVPGEGLKTEVIT